MPAKKPSKIRKRTEPASAQKADNGSARKKKKELTEEILSSDSDAEDRADAEEEEEFSEDEEMKETVGDKRLRLAKSMVQRLKDEQEQVVQEEDTTGLDSIKMDLSKEQRITGAVADKLKADLLEAQGHRMRRIAHRITPVALADGERVKVWRGHRFAVTGLALTGDDSAVYSASKEGTILKWDIETMTKTKVSTGVVPTKYTGPPYPGCFQKEGPSSGSRTVLALAVSHDGKFLASGGLDRRVHIWDARSNQHLQAFPGHKDAISALRFRQGTHQLFSCSMDRTVKMWSLDDMAYMDTLYGHQGEVMGLDVDTKERPVTVGRDRTSRMWKVQDETHLVFRASGAGNLDCVTLAGQGGWVSGQDDGSISLWNMIKKKPVMTVRQAHSPSTSEGVGAAGAWVSCVRTLRNSDLVASGAGDGFVRLWSLNNDATALGALHTVPAPGFVNALEIANSGRFLIAGVGQEPRLARWARDKAARNGIVVAKLDVSS